ncbi:MAG: diacylglycerol kinase family lipid kinase [Chitinophagaceae bacterium]|nr:diacylglycerol kinase family lipid kinase [Chitinophagaceae bacterium]
MPRKILYFINPISGTRKKTMVPEIIQKRHGVNHIPFEILATEASGEYDFLKKKIREEGVTDVVVCGGDGTVNQLANALRGNPVNIGIIPLGSGNGLALAAKIPRNIEKALDVIFAGDTTTIDSFYINGRFSCMLCGLGFDAQVAHDFAGQKKRGLLTYVKQSVKNFFRAKPYPFTLVVNGQELRTEAFFISIANSNQFGNQFTIAPRASLHDGLLDIVVVNKMSKLRMIWVVLKQIRNGQIRQYEDKKYHRNDIHYFQTRELIILNPRQAPLHIDGDPVDTAERFEISIIPNAFKLIMPGINEIIP